MKSSLAKLKSNDISVEMRLLLLCSVNHILDEQQEKIRELTSGRIDWNQFLDLSFKSRTYPVIYKNLTKIQNSCINNNILVTLEKKCKENQMNAIKLMAELLRVMELFEKQRIRAISLKGPLLGRSLYGDITLRTSRDLDILVNPEDIKKAENVLITAGYEKEACTDSLSSKQMDILIKTNHHFSYINKKTGVLIELHWKYYYDSYNFQFEEIWGRKTEVEVSGKKVNVLNTENNFLYLVFHGSKHAWKRLRWLCDVCEIILKNDLDWEYIKERANKLEISHMLGQALILSNFFFKTELHNDLFDDDRTYKTAVKLANMALPFVLNTDGSAELPGHHLYLNFKKYMMIWNTSASKKFGYIRMHFYPIQSDFEEIKFKDRWFFMYYITRPLFKLGRMLWNNGKQDKQK